jgi:hypothetical protein
MDLGETISSRSDIAFSLFVSKRQNKAGRLSWCNCFDILKCIDLLCTYIYMKLLYNEIAFELFGSEGYLSCLTLPLSLTPFSVAQIAQLACIGG